MLDFPRRTYTGTDYSLLRLDQPNPQPKLGRGRHNVSPLSPSSVLSYGAGLKICGYVYLCCTSPSVLFRRPSKKLTTTVKDFWSDIKVSFFVRLSHP